jgi:hypothetical protein
LLALPITGETDEGGGAGHMETTEEALYMGA